MIMKKNYYLLLTALLFFSTGLLTSCSDDYQALTGEDLFEQEMSAAMADARVYGQQTDAFAREVAARFNGCVTDMNYKTRESATRKCKTDNSRPYDLKDLARTTIVAGWDSTEIKPVIQYAVETATERGIFGRYKHQTSDYGYWGDIVNLKFEKLYTEIQVKTYGMFYASLDEASVRSVIGDSLFNVIRTKSGVEPGLSHHYYEIMRADTSSAETIAKYKQLAIDYHYRCEHLSDPPAQPSVVLKGKDAVEWTRNHLDSLVNVYMADCGNLLDPDMTRDLLKCIGYTRLNVSDYREAGWMIDSVVFVRLIDRAEVANNKTILFTMGMYGCGKTTSLNNNPDLKKLVSEVGVVSEGAYNNVKYFDETVEKIEKRGFKPHLIYVYNDAETGYTNCMERLIHSNRAVTCETYIAVFPQYQGRVEYIEEHHPKMEFYCLDNNHNNGGKRVTTEEARQWDYTMTEDLQQKLYAIKQSYIDSGKLNAEQIAALQ